MRIIITGATGFVGRNLAECFHDEGMDVVATGRSSLKGAELRDKGIAFEKADIRETDQVVKAFSPADCVIHCAGKSADGGTYKEFYDANVIGTRNVVEACWKHGIKKIIFTSTPSMYYNGRDRLDIKENEPLPDRQITHYPRTKRIVEIELAALQEDGYKVIMFRPRALYGRYDNTIVPRILRLAEKKKMPLINNGRALTDITYIDNFTDAVRTSLSAPDDAWNEIYNISNGDPISMRDWFATVLEIFGRPFKPKNVPVGMAKAMAAIMELASQLPFSNKTPAMTRFTVGYMSTSMTMSIEKARQKLGWTPRVGNREGFKRYAEWYQGGSTNAVT
jgi:nucleoside-diphosphate-sugar epimerase